MKNQFPIFKQHPELIYLDSAATSHKPRAVIDAVSRHMENDYATVHRGGYELATKATNEFEATRNAIAGFIGAQSDQVILTSGATAGLNLIANGIEETHLNGEVILVAQSEHHANLIPWQQLAKRLNKTLEILPLDELGNFTAETNQVWLNKIQSEVCLVAVAHVSNVLGNVYPIADLCAKAQQCNAITVIDGTQAVAHLDVNVRDLDCDFYVFSGHKMYAPTGTGVVYGKSEKLSALTPSIVGGEMVRQVSFEEATYQDAPLKFEAGTPNMSSIAGLTPAISFIQKYRSQYQHREDSLQDSVRKQLSRLKGVRVLAERSENIAVTSFVVDGIDNQSIAMALYERNIALRFGQHCAMPLLQSLGLDACLRVSIGAYTTQEDIDGFIEALRASIKELSEIESEITQLSTPTLHNSSKSKEPAHAGEGKIESTIPFSDANWYSDITKGSDWASKHRALLLMSKQLNALSPDLRTPTSFLSGCESNVWMEHIDGHWAAYSDSKVIRGILALILSLVEDHGLSTKYSVLNILSSIGLDKHFSSGRKAGVNAILNRLFPN